MPHHSNKTSFQSGHETWNKGMIGYRKGARHSLETKLRMSEIAKERWKRGTMPSKPRIRIPVDCKHCGSAYEVIPSRIEKTRFCSKECYSAALIGKPSWNSGKFHSSTYGGLHHKVRRLRGTPSLCDVCGTTEAKRFEWANMTGNYEDENDYKRMCTSCHHKHDGIVNNLASAKELESSL